MKLKRIAPFCAACALLALLSGCLLRSGVSEGVGVYVYRLRTAHNGEDNRALYAQLVLPGEGESEVDCLVRCLNSEPGSETLERVFPEDVKLLSCRIENGRAQADMSPEYSRLNGVERTLCDYALVYTFCRLDEVTAVDISCAGKTVQTGLRAESAELADAQYGPCERIIKLFVPDGSGEHLVSRSFVSAQSTDSAAEAAVRQLLLSLDEVPDATALVSVNIADGMCVLNLSEEFYTTEPESVHTSRLVISSFVDTLCFLPEVERVVIQVGGRPINSYGSCITVWPMEFDGSLISYDGG